MFCPLDPKQSQDRVFKLKLSHCSFAFWQADLCELGEIFVADPPSSGFMNGGRLDFRRLPGPVFDPPRREALSGDECWLIFPNSGW